MSAAAHDRGVVLRELVEGLACGPVPSVAVTGLADDSRQVRPGDLFVALRGSRDDGARFIADALARGAVAVLSDAPAASSAAAPVVVVPGLRGRLAEVAARFHGHPARGLSIVGVTGTNGKSSVCHLLAQAWGALQGRHTGAIIGTLGAGWPAELRPTGNTTPGVVRLHAELARLRRGGARLVALEVSSHALDQGRVEGLPVAVAALTNLSHDHLDYHGTAAAYAAAKRRLFEQAATQAAVLNLDDPFGAELAAAVARRVPVCGFTVGGRGHGTDACCAQPLDAGREGTRLVLHWRGQRQALATPLLGPFAAANIACAAAVLLTLDVPLADAAAALAAARPPPGRMQRIEGGDNGPLVLVDYAHTPDALEQALRGARALAPGALWCVFGCGGERDAAKRAPMGAIAQRLADHVVLTADNPRGESVTGIIDDIRAGMHAGERALVLEDRGAAIREAIGRASPGDVVLVAGKGHEAVQELAGESVPFDDVAVARAALEGGR